jgi:hypothetical protein
VSATEFTACRSANIYRPTIFFEGTAIFVLLALIPFVLPTVVHADLGLQWCQIGLTSHIMVFLAKSPCSLRISRPSILDYVEQG